MSLVAAQGTKFLDIIAAVRNLLQVTTQFPNPDRDIRVWFDPDSRPQLSGRDNFIWFRPILDDVDESPGPQEFGNKVECKFEVHYATRSFADEAQVDERRMALYYDVYWKIVLTFQNHNLFSKYAVPTQTSAWVQPQPPKGLGGCLSVGSMLLKSLPNPRKTQREEGTIESQWMLTVPAVLAMILR